MYDDLIRRILEYISGGLTSEDIQEDIQYWLNDDNKDLLTAVFSALYQRWDIEMNTFEKDRFNHVLRMLKT